MYGPVSKDGPALELDEVGEKIKDEVWRREVEEIVAKLKVDADSQSGVNPLATFEGDGGTVKLDHIGSGILRWQVLPDKIANDPFSFA